jgi:transcriptional regulator with PAS, ATPase and Fis domain
MRAVLDEAGRLARFDVPVLIEGETGSGKELLARYLHDRSSRRTRPLVAVNCGALPDGLLEAEFFGHARGAFTGAESARPGLLEAAHGGTLFLDEVGELSPHGQALLLRVLQQHEFRRVGEIRVRRSDFRLLAATHRPLADLAAGGRFRADLFYRLRVVRLHLPPLRERQTEIPELAAALLRRLARRHGLEPPRLSDDALEVLVRRDWPGNVRELESVLAGAFLRRPNARVIEAELVAEAHREAAGRSEVTADPLLSVLQIRRLAAARAAFERLVLLRAIRRAAGSRVRAARELGISRQSLWQKLRRHGIP